MSLSNILKFKLFKQDYGTDTDHPDDEILTVADAINYIAGLSGFTRTYERPGWIILWRGWMVFSHQVTGYSFAQRKLKRE